MPAWSSSDARGEWGDSGGGGGDCGCQSESETKDERRVMPAAEWDNDGSDDEEDEGECGAVEATYDNPDPVMTAAILTQAAFRGYRLRERLRRLPARETERAIKALHRNSDGFRRLGLFLVLYNLYFAIVFTGGDVNFERSVEQGLRAHLDSVKFGLDRDRSSNDVGSLNDFHQWLQAFYLKTYTGTQLESVCTPCAIKPSDDVCDKCDFSNTGYDPTSYAVEKSFSTSSRFGGSSFSDSTYKGLSEECGACVVGRVCGAVAAETCNYALSNSLSDFNFTSLILSSSWDGMTSYSSPSSNTSSSSSIGSHDPPGVLAEMLNTTALANLNLTPEGGVSAAGGYVTIDNVDQCRSDQFYLLHGTTENLLRLKMDLEVPFNGKSYIADRNRVIGGILLKFKRRKRSAHCTSSRGYYDGCFEDGEEKGTIRPPNAFNFFRPSETIEYDAVAEGHTILIDAGGLNVGLNFGYCTVLVFEDTHILGNDTSSVSVQLVTFNGQERTAYGSLLVDFAFSLGGEVKVTESVSAYVLQANLDSDRDRARCIALVIFFVMALATVRSDMKSYCTNRRLKVKRHKCRCCCGCTFNFLILLNVFVWLIWAGFREYFKISTEFSQHAGLELVEQLTEEIVAHQFLSSLAGSYKFLFLVTTMAGLYRLLFQKLTFHKRMSIVTDTLSRASTHLDHFLFVFFLVAFMFVYLTWLLVGSSHDAFSTVEAAWRSVIRISLGESENFYPQILEAQPTVGPVVVVLYQVLGVVLLLNVVVAIILEAYGGVVAGIRDEDTIFQSLTAFLGMTMLSWKTRIRWAGSHLLWRMSWRQSKSTRPSLKAALQGPTGVIGIDGQPVVMVRRPDPSKAALPEKQLSFNCPRYITVTEMQALIEAAPVPTFVAERVVRRIVHHWVFHSEEKVGLTIGYTAPSGGRLEDALPMLRRRTSTCKESS